MAFRGPVQSKGSWNTVQTSSQGDTEFAGITYTGQDAGITYSPTNNRTTNIYGDRWVLNFWFKVDGNLNAVYGYTTYNGVSLSYEQSLIFSIEGSRILNSSGTTAGTNYIESSLNIQLEGSNTTNHNIQITYTPTFVAGKQTLTNITWPTGKWINLTLAYNVTYNGTPNRFVARVMSQDGTVNQTVYNNLTYGTSASATGYRTMAVDRIRWSGLFQAVTGNGINYNNIVSRPSYANNITANYDRFFFDTYTLSDTVVFEDFFNATNNNQNFVVPTSLLAPQAGYDWGEVYPLSNRKPVYYLYKDSTDFGDNTNLVGADWTVTGSGTYGPNDAGVHPSYLTYDASFIAAPGFIKLGQAQLDSAHSAGKDDGAYIEPGYTDPADYFLDVDYNYGSFNADIILGTRSYPEVDVDVSATGAVTARGALNESADFNFVSSGGRIFSQTTAVDADFTQTALAKNTIVASMSESVDFEVTATAGVIRGSQAADNTVDTEQSATGAVTYDIGLQYANDWVGQEQDYVGPYQFLNLLIEFELYAAASVEIIPEANLQAESLIQGTGGYFLSFAQSLIGADAQFNLEPFTLAGGTGLIFNQATDLSVDTEQSALGGLVFDGQAQFDLDTEFDPSGGRYQLLASDLVVETNIDNTTDLFKSTDIFFEVDTDVLATGGKLWTAYADFADEFIVPAVRARIISIDEYYVSKVQKEFRTLRVFQDQRTIWIPVEPRTLSVFQEDRINQVDAENRYLRPEPGTPIQVGSRNRRIVA